MKIGETFGVDSEDIARAIKNYQPGLLRSEFLEYKGAHWTVDCYNANPSSMRVAIDSFINSSQGKKGLILGGMREMGDYSQSEHQKLVDYVIQQNPDLVILVGNEFGTCTIPENFHLFKTSLEAKNYLESISVDGFDLLLKGSRGIKMEVVINR
jgi:UDP-N-acetylmuramoyl-tripeptide--D-alanyl-D-alanine ligase